MNPSPLDRSLAEFVATNDHRWESLRMWAANKVASWLEDLEA